jgi:hypothetical protein
MGARAVDASNNNKDNRRTRSRQLEHLRLAFHHNSMGFNLRGCGVLFGNLRIAGGGFRNCGWTAQVRQKPDVEQKISSVSHPCLSRLATRNGSSSRTQMTLKSALPAGVSLPRSSPLPILVPRCWPTDTFLVWLLILSIPLSFSSCPRLRSRRLLWYVIPLINENRQLTTSQTMCSFESCNLPAFKTYTERMAHERMVHLGIK